MSDERIVEIGPLPVPDLPERMVRVFVPDGFAEQEFRPMLLMFDGQNIFDDEASFSGGWHVHDHVASLDPAHSFRPVVVGVNHGNEARLDGLGPFPTKQGGGKADNLLGWIGDTVLPMIAQHLPVTGGPLGTVVGGSSMGGLASLYAHFARPDLFGGAIVMSPSLWFGQKKVFDFVTSRPTPAPSRLYMDWGTKEGDEMTGPARAMAAHVKARGYADGQLALVEDEEGTHSEGDWQRRLPGALAFMFRK